jgi:hypothetical protein
MRIVLVIVDYRFAEIQTVAILTAEIHDTLVAIIVYFRIVIGIDSDRVFFFKDPENTVFKKIIVGFQMMGD